MERITREEAYNTLGKNEFDSFVDILNPILDYVEHLEQQLKEAQDKRDYWKLSFNKLKDIRKS